MENNDLLNIVAVALLSAAFAIILKKKHKVESEKQELQQEMINRKHEIKHEIKDLPQDEPFGTVCLADPQYAFMQDLLDQVNEYLYTVNVGLFASLIPLTFIVATNLMNAYMPPDTGNKFMPPTVDCMGLTETNAQVYMADHFKKLTPMERFLKKMLVNKCTSGRAIDQWNLLKNLESYFIKRNIPLNEQNHILMAALNVQKITKPQIGLLSNYDYKFPQRAIDVARYLAKHCITPDQRFNPILHTFSGSSNTVGGVLANSKEFIDRLEQIQRAKQRIQTMAGHYPRNR